VDVVFLFPPGIFFEDGMREDGTTSHIYSVERHVSFPAADYINIYS